MDTDHKLINQFFLKHPDIAVQSIDELSPKDLADLLEMLTPTQAVMILTKLPVYKTGKIIELINATLASELVDLLDHSVSQAILRVSDKSISDEIIAKINPEKATALRRTLKYPKNLVGAHIEPFVLTLSSSINIKKARALIKNNKTIIKPHIFVLDDKGLLVGYVELKSIIASDPELQIQSILKTVAKPAFVDMSTKDLRDHWDNTFLDLPVVNASGEFIGTVSRSSLNELNEEKNKIDNAAIKAGIALGDLYLIGLTSLLALPVKVENSPENKN